MTAFTPLRTCLTLLAGITLAAPARPAGAQTCASDADCRSGDAQRIGWCRADRCQFAPRDQPDCRQRGAAPLCWLDLACKDGQSETIDWCYQERCHSAPRASGSCAADPCDSDRACDDFDVSTQDWCHLGTCVHAARDQPACLGTQPRCTHRRECLDGDRETVDWCWAGRCYHAQRDQGGRCDAGGCEPQRVVLTQSRRGAVNNPEQGGRWKVVGDSYQIRYQRGTSSNVARTLNYHCFDLDGLNGRVVSATLELAHSDNSYESEDISETVIFRPLDREPCDASLDRSVLSPPENWGALFADLNDGPVLAQFQATMSDNNQIERFSVNATGLASLQQRLDASTPWGIAGGLSSADAPQRGALERVFRGTDNTAGNFMADARLILEILPPGCF